MISRRTVLKSAALGAAGMMPNLAFGQTAKYAAKVAHLEAPTQPRHKGLEKVGALVKERTGGEVEFTLYPLSQLGNARQMIEGTQFGAIECTVQPAAFLGGFDPVVSVLDVPYLFPTDRAVSQKLREGPFGQALLKSFDSRGLYALTEWPNGRKSLTSNKPLDNLVELAGQKFRVMDSKILIDQFTAVGATAVAINFGELYTSLQTGLVDGQENPLDTITTMKFYEVQKNLVVTEHGAMEDFVLFNPTWWQALPDGHKEIIKTTFDEVRPEVEKMKEEAAVKSLELIKAANVNVRTADEAERNKLRDATAPAARAAYVSLAGAEGEEVLKIYDAEMKKLAG
jgi:tripartite ATP-independent transporter DctP family solute receptor